MTRAIAQMQALPTVLAPIVRIRKEELELKYISTRGDAASSAASREILLEGLAPDGGLYLPQRYPQVDARDARALARPRLSRARVRDPVALHRRHPARATCARSSSKHLHRAKSSATSASRRCEPLEPRLHPASAVERPDAGVQGRRDAAARQPVRVRARRAAASTLNILGATSGDTGSAAEYALRGKRGIDVFMLSPHGRMSPFQQAQMFSLQDAEHPQHRDRRRVRRLPGPRQGGLERPRVQARARASAPSTRSTGRACWPRSSTTSPATCRRRAADGERGRASRCRPATSATSAPATSRAQMGLPIRRLVLATNENDVLDEFFRTGTYRVRARRRDARDVEPVDGHLEGVELRALRLRCGRPRRARARASCSTPSVRARAARSRSTPDERARVAQLRLRRGSQHARRPRRDDPRHLRGASATVIDTHTADGLKVAREHAEAGVPMIVLETGAAREVQRRPSSRRSASSRRGRRVAASRRCRAASRRCRADVDADA